VSRVWRKTASPPDYRTGPARWRPGYP